jgi:hypothetical protein
VTGAPNAASCRGRRPPTADATRGDPWVASGGALAVVGRVRRIKSVLILRF